MSREKFEELLQLIPEDLVSALRDQAVAEGLVEEIFGKATGKANEQLEL